MSSHEPLPPFQRQQKMADIDTRHKTSRDVITRRKIGIDSKTRKEKNNRMNSSSNPRLNGSFESGVPLRNGGRNEPEKKGGP
jgi:hypothetical protein